MSATPGDRLEADLIEDALLTAGIGTWSVDLATQSVGCVHEYWPTCAGEFWPT